MSVTHEHLMGVLRDKINKLIGEGAYDDVETLAKSYAAILKEEPASLSMPERFIQDTSLKEKILSWYTVWQNAIDARAEVSLKEILGINNEVSDN